MTGGRLTETHLLKVNSRSLSTLAIRPPCRTSSNDTPHASAIRRIGFPLSFTRQRSLHPMLARAAAADSRTRTMILMRF